MWPLLKETLKNNLMFMKKKGLFLPFAGILFLFAALLSSCSSNPESAESTATESETVEPPVMITSQAYGQLEDGRTVDQYQLKNANGMAVEVITYGGIITSWTAPDKTGAYENVVLGYDSLSQYLANNPYFGAIIGRYGNRIAKGQFVLEGTTYELATNDGPNHLHGGLKGFDKVLWSADTATTAEGASLILRYESADMEEGYPGNLSVQVTYTLTPDDALQVDYEATTDKATIVNLTQHSYFNLSGDFSQTILDHELMIAADQYLPVDATLIPTGELAPVEGTPFDFREAKAIGRDIGADHPQLELGKGYDHCWVLNEQGSMRRVASAYHPGTGRQLEVFTDEPGIQFYSGNFLDGTLPMPGGGTYGHRTGFCLETQHYPDSPNQKDFPSVVLRPGETYETRTTFKFSTK